VNVGAPSDPGRQALLDALERRGVDYLVIGAAAAEALGWSGRSEDIDIVPETSRVPGGFDARLLATKQVWNLMTLHGQLDITTHPSGTGGYADLIERASPQRIPGTTAPVPVASAADIIASKSAAGRPKDIAMLPALRRELAPWLDQV
jgi:hypothetical protein